MVVDLARIERLEKELSDARAQLWKEDAERYRILMRDIPPAEREKFMSNLTDRRERILFGLDAPDERKHGTPSGHGDLSCPVCGKHGLTKRGLNLHMIRLHKDEVQEDIDTLGTATR